MKIKKSVIIKDKGIVDNMYVDLSKADIDTLEQMNEKIAEILSEKYLDKGDRCDH